jgi:formate hydrogenlyase subunit 4
VAGSWSIPGILSAFAAHPWYAASPFLLITLIALGLVVLAENARYPVDNPATHLELTMVHEAMILEYSGPYLAMLEYAAALKFTGLSVFFMNLLLPFGMLTEVSGGVSFLSALFWLLIKLVLASSLVAMIESTVVKMRFYRMQEYMTLGFIFSLSGLILTLVL